jgi:hypothetical protein
LLAEYDLEEGELVVVINRIHNKIREGLNETCKNIAGYEEIKQKVWITDNTLNNFLERWNLKEKINTGRTRNQKANANKEYQSKDKEVKRMICNDKRKFTEQLADKLQEAANIGNIKVLYENTKLL